MILLSHRIFRRVLLVSGLGILFVAEALADEPAYLSSVTDLPLPPGMTEDVEAGLVFDKPEGRIVEALARGAIEKSDVAGFYRAALPELGWRKLADDASASRWQRGDEILRVDIVDGGDPLVVRFSIAPK